MRDVLRALRGPDDDTLPDRTDAAYRIAYAAYYAPASRRATPDRAEVERAVDAFLAVVDRIEETTPYSTLPPQWRRAIDELCEAANAVRSLIFPEDR